MARVFFVLAGSRLVSRLHGPLLRVEEIPPCNKPVCLQEKMNAKNKPALFISSTLLVYFLGDDGVQLNNSHSF